MTGETLKTQTLWEQINRIKKDIAQTEARYQNKRKGQRYYQLMSFYKSQIEKIRHKFNRLGTEHCCLRVTGMYQGRNFITYLTNLSKQDATIILEAQYGKSNIKIELIETLNLKKLEFK